jgi:hypothetical protein
MRVSIRYFYGAMLDRLLGANILIVISVPSGEWQIFAKFAPAASADCNSTLMAMTGRISTTPRRRDE